MDAISHSVRNRGISRTVKDEKYRIRTSDGLMDRRSSRKDRINAASVAAISSAAAGVESVVCRAAVRTWYPVYTTRRRKRTNNGTCSMLIGLGFHESMYSSLLICMQQV